jgi:hypothetical protein
MSAYVVIEATVRDWPHWQSDIQEAAVDAPLRPGAAFRWSTFGMQIVSTVYALELGRRILWGGESGGIVGIHEWTFTDLPDGVEVRTRESFAGAPVAADVPQMQALLDGSLVSWLRQLKDAAESAGAFD